MESWVIILLTVFGALLLFLIMREFFTWYTKQNQVVSLLTEIRDLLKKD